MFKETERRVSIKYALLIDERFLYCFIDRLPYGVQWTDIISDKTLTNLSVDVGVGETLRDDENKLLVRDGVTFRKYDNEIAYMVPFGGNMFPAKFLLRSFQMPEHAPPAALPLGIAADKSHGYIDIAEIFHLLVVGPTGRGKSTLLHSFILTILDRNTPDDVRLWLIDCKETEFPIYEPLNPKRQKSIVERIEYNEEKATTLLQEAVQELDHRRKKFKDSNASNLDDYCEKTGRPLPRIIIVIDEIARLMLCDDKLEKKKIKDWAEYLLIMLATQGRSFGLHLIIATQYVQKDILTAGILLNFENVVCFGVKNMWQSNLAINDYHMAVGLERGIIVFKRAETGPRQYSKFKAPLVEPAERRFIVSRIQHNGPGGHLHIPTDEQKLIEDAILCVRSCNEQLGGLWSISKVFKCEGVFGVLPKARVEEISKILTAKDVLPVLHNRKPRQVNPVVGPGNEHILEHILTTKKPHKTDQTDEDGILDQDDQDKQELLTCSPTESPIPDTPPIDASVESLTALFAQLHNDIRSALEDAGTPMPDPAPAPTGDIIIQTSPQVLDAFAYAPFMHKRRDVRFHSIRKWRLQAKDAQMKLLLEMKRTCDPTIIDAIASEIVNLLKDEYRIGTGAITNPPPGGSGKKAKGKHFATAIALAVARQLGLPYFAAFHPRLHTKGHSPKAQVFGDLPPLTLNESPPASPIILIDDVSTYGTTIAEATDLLQAATAVIPIVWLAGETSLDDA